jgi:hypothetical protein
MTPPMLYDKHPWEGKDRFEETLTKSSECAELYRHQKLLSRRRLVLTLHLSLKLAAIFVGDARVLDVHGIGIVPILLGVLPIAARLFDVGFAVIALHFSWNRKRKAKAG